MGYGYNLLVHYSFDAGYLSARREIESTIISLGDKKPVIDKLKDGSVIGVKTVLEAKEVIQELKEKSFANPGEFSATIRWIPVELWCPAGMNAIQKEINEIKQQISAGERWSVDIETWQKTPSSEEIFHFLKNFFSAERYVEENGSKIIFVEFQGDECAISILKQDDFFVVVPV